MLQDTYNWAVGKSSDAADKVAGAAKDAESDAGQKASSLKKDADKDASRAHAEAKGYVESAQDSAKVHSQFANRSLSQSTSWPTWVWTT